MNAVFDVERTFGIWMRFITSDCNVASASSFSLPRHEDGSPQVPFDKAVQARAQEGPHHRQRHQLENWKV